MTVYFTPQAETDLEEIGDYIALDNPNRATTFVREIREHCEQIASDPLRYEARPELGDKVRTCAHGNYVIFFRALRRRSAGPAHSSGREKLFRCIQWGSLGMPPFWCGAGRQAWVIKMVIAPPPI